MNPTTQKLKQWLKDTAVAIRTIHAEIKDHQRANNGAHGWDNLSKWNRLRHDYRHHHIAYSELRGYSRQEIERPKKDNLPNESYIQQIKDEYSIKEPIAAPQEIVA
jgi:hypothetical protein